MSDRTRKAAAYLLGNVSRLDLLTLRGYVREQDACDPGAEAALSRLDRLCCRLLAAFDRLAELAKGRR